MYPIYSHMKLAEPNVSGSEDCCKGLSKIFSEGKVLGDKLRELHFGGSQQDIVCQMLYIAPRHYLRSLS
jgi:hypothetical protein